MKKVFAVHDTKAACFGSPLFFSTRGEAMRAFGDEANRAESMIHKHSTDFVLYEIGEYDEVTGVLTPQKHHCIGFASDFKQVGQGPVKLPSKNGLINLEEVPS